MKKILPHFYLFHIVFIFFLFTKVQNYHIIKKICFCQQIFYILKIPNLLSEIGAFREADNAKARTARVSSGSITPSSHNLQNEIIIKFPNFNAQFLVFLISLPGAGKIWTAFSLKLLDDRILQFFFFFLRPLVQREK